VPESEKALRFEGASSRAYQRRAQVLEGALLRVCRAVARDEARALEIAEAAIREEREARI